MRTEPTWRIPIGILALFAGLMIYGFGVAAILAPVITDWPVWLQTPIYIVLGVVWLLPLKNFLIWMETGRWGV